MPVIKRYLKLLIVSYAIVFIFRSLEIFLLIKNYGWQLPLLFQETAGIFIDLLIVNALFTVILPFYYLLYRLNVRLADYVFLLFTFIAAIAHLAVIKYFVYQLIPLDIFLYQYSFKEVFFTVKSSDTDYISMIIAIALLIALGLLIYKLLIRVTLSGKSIIIAGLFVVASFPVVVFGHAGLLSLNKFSLNKSYYFYHRSVSFFLSKKNGDNADQRTFKEYQQLFDDNEYIRRDYPLLHTFKNRDVLGKYFKKADTPPNIIILIVEGLNDDFLYPVKGTDLMPFLMDLKSKSLYWDHFFSTGERSFAAVPSIVGGLPYGEKGFTLLNILPYHYTLMNVLHMNGYRTGFFYGQGSWFHKKDRYFRFNNTDLIFDKDKFSEKYDKIIVGKDNFFWGYNDKDLFKQAFEVLDTLSQTLRKRFEIYFTGTSHSPYKISNQAYYDELFLTHREGLKNQEDKQYFDTYKTYIQSILFVDDALRYFFETCQKRPEYDNTIFIITGDHPMSEIPVKNSLKRYHVPLIIYSPLLKDYREFHGISDYADLYETILSYLSSNYALAVPPVSTSLGAVLDTASVSLNKKSIAFMNDNREIVDFYDNGYYVSNAADLFKTTDNLDLVSVNDEKLLKKMTHKTAIFKKVSQYVSLNRRIIPEEIYFSHLGYEVFYSRADSQTVIFNSEFHDIVERTKVSNQTLFYDILFHCKNAADKKTGVVFQLSNDRDSIVFWQSMGLPENGEFQEHIKIPEQALNDSVLFFKSFFWNTVKEKFEYTGLETFLYGD